MGLMHDKVVLISGGAGSIGSSCANLFAGSGARCIFLADSSFDDAEEISLSIAARSGVECIPVKVNQAKEREVKAVFDIIRERTGMLDVLVNCTRLERIVKTEEEDIESWDFTMSMELKGAFLFSKEALRMMKKQGYGTIISVVPQADSHSGWTADSDDYSSSKAGLVYLTKTLAGTAAKYGITVKGVSAKVNCNDIQTEKEQRDGVLAFGGAGVKEIGDTVMFLASDHARYMTGACIDVNCGLAM